MEAAAAMSDVGGAGCRMADVESQGPALRLVGGAAGAAGAGGAAPFPIKWGDGGFIREPGGGDGGAAQGGGGPGKRRGRGGRGVGGGRGAGAAGRAGGEREWNAAVYLTAFPVPGVASCLGGSVSEFTAHAGTVATRDKADRAHQVRNHGSGLLTCAAELDATMTRPRRYPRHQMTSRGVAFDSAFDELHARQTALGEMGIGDMGGDWARRSVGSVSGITLERAAAEAAARGTSLRELTRQRLNEPSMGDSEESAEAYALRQIALHKAGVWAPSDGGGK